jgi:uroporphyrin-III C-methyltransferase
LAEANVVLYDALANEVVVFAPKKALKIFVGKEKGVVFAR